MRFEAIYREHGRAVRTYARRRSDAQTADDIAAEVFVVAWRRLDEVPAEPLPWLLGVARRVLANRRRGWARDEELRERIASEHAVRAPSASALPPSDGAVVRALSELSEGDRETLLLVAWEGLAPSQAARVLGVSRNTFSARMYRARKRFARALADYSGETDQRWRPTNAEVLP